MNSETSFTPGPWFYSFDFNEVRLKDGYMKGSDMTICTMPHDFLGEPLNKANARLIAAAPDMYKGLQEAVLELQAVADSLFEGGCGGQGMETTISKYEAILAKARGEA